MFRSTASRIVLIILFAVFLGYYDLPNSYQKFPYTPKSIQNSKIHLGLDLQGGSQLDYKIDLRKVQEKDQAAIVEGVKTVINRRVNSLGVSEPNIYTSSIGNEQHLIVELAGVKDLEEAKKVVGKTIQLEFKEKKAKEDPQHKENVRKLVQEILNRVTVKKEAFEVVGQEESQATPEQVQFSDQDWQFASGLSDKDLAASFAKASAGTVISKLFESKDAYTIKDGQITSNNGFFVAKLKEKRDTSTLDASEKSLQTSHILVAYRGAEKATSTITRSKDDAKKLAGELLLKLKSGAKFEDLAKQSSDEPQAKDTAGKLADPVANDGKYADAFTAAALKLTKVGELSDVVETPFGFHIIRADDFTQVKFSQIFFPTADDPWQETGLSGEQFERADVEFSSLQPIVAIKFNSDGAKLFEAITARNVGKPVAIFVGGNLISSPTVDEKISGGSAIIRGRFNVDEAKALARDLNTGAIPAPVILSGQYTIGATLGEQALHTSLKAGFIGIIALVLFMLFNYRLPGLVALVALGLYTTLLVFLIKSELSLPISLAIALLVFISIIYTILKSKEDGWEKLVTFILASFVLFFVTFLLSNAVVLTLAGVAGVILSIGMAVDANILIFERTKEELRAGRPLSSAIDVGFDRAWSSIRDSNFSSLITCSILFYFGTSIIQGFAFNLAAGILISMFTAITITKTLLRAVMHTKLGEKLWLWGLPKTTAEEHAKKTYHIVEKSKLWFGLSGTVIVISLISLFIFKLNTGIDFNGGTLLDLTFQNTVTVDGIKQALNANASSVHALTPASSAGDTLESGNKGIDFGSARVVSAGGTNQFLINIPHIDNDTHEKLLKAFESKFGKFTENRFTTIGPVVGETLKNKAVLAVIVALVMIVLYIAFAFRKVPKRVSPWKFGVCAIVALFHDVIIPLGVFSVFHFEIDALFITAMLTVLGFSVHDTIVVFDRIRENLKYQNRDESFTHIANKSMTQTMTRSINTSMTTMIMLIALLVFGSPSIFNFILVLVIGIFVGTYSSIFIASPLLVLWQKKSDQ